MQKPKAVLLQDYSPPAYRVSDVHLTFDIFTDETIVTSRLSVQRAPHCAAGSAWKLDGEKLELRAVKLNGQSLDENQYLRDDESLSLDNLPESFELTIVTAVKPHENKSGLGLYISSATMCTQMEAEGFRRITFFPDRPDVMSRYETVIRADKKRFPVLLANGDLLSARDLGEGRHEAVFRDPFAKPCYLFALVAGDLGKIEELYTTASGRKVKLAIYSEHGNQSRCRHAMDSLIKSMRWDEEVFGLEYDLDTFNIVAVNDFNFGAMENKGLNIFNTLYVLADPESATDEDYFNVERVIAHEYFHNWTGNRVTLRDWFQLTLKEGLTVLRDQEFSSDMNSRAVEKIRNARAMRERQFLEDAGPNAHPIRPESYIEIDNFYTTTVYQKGAEVIGMLRTLLGPETFVRAVQEYLRRFDGQAVTTEDFLAVMSEVGKRDLTQFKRWYSQAGTPKVRVSEFYDAANQRYELTFVQSCAPTPGQPEKKPFLIPVAIALLGRTERGEVQGSENTYVLELKGVRESFHFEGLSARPVPSLLRDFSAPISLEFEYTQEDLCFLLAHDSDAFSRYEAGQRLAMSFLRRSVADIQRGKNLKLDQGIAEALGKLLQDTSADPAFRAQALAMPSLQSLCDSMEVPDFDAAMTARRNFVREIALHNQSLFLSWYQQLSSDLGSEYRRDALSMGKRALKNICLAYLLATESSEALDLGLKQFQQASNMTDRFAAFQSLMHVESSAKEQAIQAFYDSWKSRPAILDLWISAQLGVPHIDVLPVLLKLEKDPAVDLHNPNKLGALYRSFVQNLPQFHRISGEGYRVIADRIISIDKYNPNVAAQISKSFHWYGRLDPQRKQAARVELERVVSVQNLSKGVFEIVQRTLDAR
ncbi:MAG: aminopeptidase N [Deltaproteobacteria bacterium]|nr:aminopeptidase N [Deltaproteobacteria bacterium]